MTSLEPNADDPVAVAAARRATGDKARKMWQAIRNARWQHLIDQRKQFFKANMPVWDFTACNMDQKINVIADEDYEDTEGYPLKERSEDYYVGALLGLSVQNGVASALRYEQRSMRSRYAAKKVTSGNRVEVDRKGMWRLCAAADARDGVDVLEMLPETTMKNLIVKKRYRIDYQSFLVQGITGGLTPVRSNVAMQLERNPECSQEDLDLVPILLYGEELGPQSIALNDTKFGAKRKERGLPTFLECHQMTPAESRQTVQLNRLPLRSPFFGRQLLLPQRAANGRGIVIDRHCVEGDSPTFVQVMRTDNMLVKSFVDNVGHTNAAGVICAGAGQLIAVNGHDFYQRISQAVVDRMNTTDAWRALGETMGVSLINPSTGHALAVQDRFLTDVMKRATIHHPCRFMGIVASDDLLRYFYESKRSEEADITSGTIHLYLVRSKAAPQHIYTVAWQFSAEYLEKLANTREEADKEDVEDHN